MCNALTSFAALACPPADLSSSDRLRMWRISSLIIWIRSLRKKLVHVMYPLIIRLMLSVWNLIYYNSYLSLQNHVICFQWTCPRPFPLLHIIRFCWSSVFFAILGVALFFSTLARIHICFGPRVRLIGFDIHICTKQFWRKSCLNELGSGVAFAVLIPRISHHLAC